MTLKGLFGSVIRGIGDGLFTALEDERGDSPTPPEAILLVAENGQNLITENSNNYIIN